MWSKRILSCTFLLFVLNSVQSQTVVNFSEYTAIMDDSTGLARTVFYRLTKEMVEASGTYDRPSNFHLGEGISESYYRNSGFDKGHLKPVMHSTWDSVATYESMDMANVIAEFPSLNRGVIKFFEQYSASLAKSLGCILVFIHVPSDPVKMPNGLYVPSGVVYDIRTCDNKQIDDYSFLNIPK